MNNIINFLSDYISEYMIIILFLISVGFFFLSILLPKEAMFHNIDFKRMLNKEKINMSKINRYILNLSTSTIFSIFTIKENSKAYKKYEHKIKLAGGLNGSCPEVINTIKWMMFLVGIIVTTIWTPFIINDFKIIFFLLLLNVVIFFIPDIYIKIKIVKRKEALLKELETIELFASIYLDAGYNIYDLLMGLKDITTITRPYIIECINEFYIGPEQALQNLADKVILEEYQTLIDMLKQGIVISKNNVSSIIGSHVKQLKKERDLLVEERVKRSPLKYVFTLALPFISILIVWFYPILIEAIKSFDFTFSF